MKKLMFSAHSCGLHDVILVKYHQEVIDNEYEVKNEDNLIVHRTESYFTVSPPLCNPFLLSAFFSQSFCEILLVAIGPVSLLPLTSASPKFLPGVTSAS